MTLPKHIGIIMDGNGRWAQARRKPRVYGHIRGAKVARNVIETCASEGIGYLTLFAFSTENWWRPEDEVTVLMRLLRRHLQRERSTLMKNKIRFQAIGEIEKLPELVRAEIEKTENLTKNNSGMVLSFALSYGGRQDITQAIKKIAQDVQRGALKPDQINLETINPYLWTKGMPDPDIILRTSGELRISNFLLWQGAYSELIFSDVMWPDFSERHLRQAFKTYAERNRRFGRVEKTTHSEPPIGGL